MGLFGKPKISEIKAAAQFILAVMTDVKENWSGITAQFRPFLRDDARQLDSPWAQYEVALASMAVQMQALANLVSLDQARRIRDHVRTCLSTPELGTASVQGLQEYERAWDDTLRVSEPPFGAVASVLYDRLELDASVSVGGQRFKDPLLLMAMGGAVTTVAGGWWKELLSKYKVDA